MSNFLSAPDPIQQAAITALQAAIDAEPDRVIGRMPGPGADQIAHFQPSSRRKPG